MMPTRLSDEGLSLLKSPPHGIDRARILLAAKSEMHRHRWDFFVDRLSSGQDGKEIRVLGCMGCRKRLSTTSEFVDHLYEVALPRIIELSELTGRTNP